MKKVEAPTLEEAYKNASQMLECSISELHTEVVQYPQKGILGFLKKNAIIVATCKVTSKVKKVDQSFVENTTDEEDVAKEILETLKNNEVIVKPITEPTNKDENETTLEKDKIVDGFFDDAHTEIDEVAEEAVVYDELALMIENQLKDLFSKSCFAIDVVEVDVLDNTALIFIDGDDAALLIGKEGYRYNALSYILFNWLHTKYELFIKLEIAEFFTMQQKMIKSYIKPVIEEVKTKGRAKTRFLDGILVQIALEQLREEFPNKYVAVKTTKEGKKFIVINEFNTKINA